MVSPLKINIPSKNIRKKPTNTPIIHSVYQLCMVAATCFGISQKALGTLPEDCNVMPKHVGATIHN
jgi:hypothetical protein